MLHDKPNPKICPLALLRMKLRVTNRPYDAVQKEEARLWLSKSDCPGLGLRKGPESPKPLKKEIGERLSQPMTEMRLH